VPTAKKFKMESLVGANGQLLKAVKTDDVGEIVWETNPIATCPHCKASLEGLEMSGKPEREEVTLDMALEAIVNALAPGKITMKDSEQAFELLGNIREFRASKNGATLKLGIGVMKWLKGETGIIATYAPHVFRKDAYAVSKALDNFERAHEAQEEE
jgi:hypothetical protein